MAIRRTAQPFEQNFTQIPNGWLRDRRLSRRARGLLAELMTHQIGWEVTLDSLIEGGTEGRDAIRGAITELEGFGYLTRERSRDGGRFKGTDYVLTDPGSPRPEKPTSVKPTSVKPTSVNPPLRRTSLLEDHYLLEDHKEPEPSGTGQDALIQMEPEVTPEARLVADAQVVAKRLVELHPALKYPAMMTMAKRMMVAYGVDVPTVGRAMDSLYRAGRPITDQTVGQALEGHVNAATGRATIHEQAPRVATSTRNLADTLSLMTPEGGTLNIGGNAITAMTTLTGELEA
jgi:hypothetical protein